MGDSNNIDLGSGNYSNDTLTVPNSPLRGLFRSWLGFFIGIFGLFWTLNFPVWSFNFPIVKTLPKIRKNEKFVKLI